MDVGNEFRDLNLTSDEIDRFTKAFKDEEFKRLLMEYAQEISDPETRKTYEEEIKLLEQERGNSIEFIHPTPFKVLKTSADGSQKCYINICVNEKIGKPEFKCAVSEDGRRGQCWSLPHSFHPGRQNKDPKGDKYMIYDVIFHPDTLYIATKNKRFMDMVESTAIQGIQKTFNMILDENNVREMKTKYKGIPQPCVIRKPIPGDKAKKPPEQPDPLAFPYPDVTRPSESPPKTINSFQIQPQKPKEPTKPNYKVKYRSVIDIQDFRCSRDSAQSPRPKEIVITIDLPLLKSASNTSLEVKEKFLLLESKQPAYRLELPLAYPVDEDSGEAKFNKQSRQLIITLPVRPPHEPFDFCVRPATPGSDSQTVDEEKKERSGVEEDEEWENEGSKREEQEKDRGEEERRAKEQKGERHQKTGKEQVQNSEEENKTDEQKKTSEQLEIKGQEIEEGDRGVELPQHKPHEEKLQEKKEVNKEEDGKNPAEKETTAADNKLEASSQTENQHILTLDEHTGLIEEEKEAESISAMELASKETTTSQNNIEGVSTSQGGMMSSQMFATDVTNTPSRKGLTAVSVKQKENDADGDDLPAQQIFQTPEHNEKPPAAFLREIHADGNETVISNHSTSAGFVFQNKLMYELD